MNNDVKTQQTRENVGNFLEAYSGDLVDAPIYKKVSKNWNKLVKKSQNILIVGQVLTAVNGLIPDLKGLPDPRGALMVLFANAALFGGLGYFAYLTTLPANN